LKCCPLDNGCGFGGYFSSQFCINSAGSFSRLSATASWPPTLSSTPTHGGVSVRAETSAERACTDSDTEITGSRCPTKADSDVHHASEQADVIRVLRMTCANLPKHVRDSATQRSDLSRSRLSSMGGQVPPRGPDSFGLFFWVFTA
jgi:hypothetical protein